MKNGRLVLRFNLIKLANVVGGAYWSTLLSAALITVDRAPVVALSARSHPFREIRC
jgi:hypothetical protein